MMVHIFAHTHFYRKSLLLGIFSLHRESLQPSESAQDLILSFEICDENFGPTSFFLGLVLLWR